jgi:hypothetical protein
MKSLKTKKNTQTLEKIRNKHLKKRNMKPKQETSKMHKSSLKKSLKYNKKGGGEFQLDDNFNQEYENIDGTVKIEENFEGVRGIGDGLKIQPGGKGGGMAPMPEMPDCCIL